MSDHALGQSLIDYETRLENPDHLEQYLRVRKRAVLVGEMACGYTFAMIASGKLDGKIAIDPYAKSWDFARGSLLVQEAGGVARNIGSTGYNYRNPDFIIASPIVYRELAEGPDAVFPST